MTAVLPGQSYDEAVGSAPPGSPVASSLVARLARRIVARGGERRGTIAPFTGATLAELPVSGTDDVVEAARRAREAQREWAQWPVRQRARIFLRYHDMVLDRQSEVLDLIQWESGKARRHAYEEVGDVANVARYYSRTARHYLEPRGAAAGMPLVIRAHQHQHPKGLVAMITPWNYPLSMGVTDSIPALLAGNAVLHKPDAQTPLTALWAIDLLEEAGLPAGLIQVVYGSGTVLGPTMIDNSDYVCFTGSTATGRVIGERAGRRLIGCSLELGGKNAQIILADADIRKAAAGAVRAAFSSAGQLCISMERVLVHESVYEEFLAEFVRRVSALRLSPALDYTADMGSLASADQLKKVSEHVEDARAKGATILAGGRARPDLGPFFYEPTVLADVTEDMAVCHEETFGPVVSVWPFARDAEAVDWANNTPYGLNASVFTRDVPHGRRVAAQIRAGTVNINEGYGATWSSVDVPMGGMGHSGLSRRHGAEGILKYTESQAIASMHGVGFDAPRGISQQRWNDMLTAYLRARKAVGLR